MNNETNNLPGRRPKSGVEDTPLMLNSSWSRVSVSCLESGALNGSVLTHVPVECSRRHAHVLRPDNYFSRDDLSKAACKRCDGLIYSLCAPV